MKKMKIFSIAIMVAVLCLCTMQIAFAEAVTPEGYFQVDGMTYKLDSATNTASTYIYGTYKVDGETETYKYTTTATSITIPATIKVPDGQYAGTYKVTKIGQYTFGAPKDTRGQTAQVKNTTTETITINAEIEEIADNAFYYCAGLKPNLVLPDTITKIGKSAFVNCSALDYIIGLENTKITEILDGTFNNCYDLLKLNLPSTVTSIHMNAFKNTRHIQTIRINSEEVTLTAADKTYGFPAALGLIPDKIADNGSAETPTVFYVKTEAIKNRLIELAQKDVVSGTKTTKTYKLSGIRDGSQIKIFFDPFDPIEKPIVEGDANTITYEPYYDPDSKDIIIGAIITGNNIAANSNAEIEIPSTIEVNGGINIPVKAVGTQAFCYLDADGKPAKDGKTINSIVLPETVTSIGKQAFYRQNDIIKFVAKGDIELNDDNTAIFSGCSQINEVDFKSINKLTDKMFDYCLRLESIVIPTGSSITIDKTAFDRCANSSYVSRFDVYLNAGTVTFAGDDDKGTMKLENSIMYFHVPTETAKTALTEYGIADANVIVGKELYLVDNALGTYAVASKEINEGKIIVATYKNDELVAVDEIKDVDFGVGYNAIETSLEVAKGIVRKIFVWSDLTSMIPLGAMIN